jgi:rare lipoprotein A
MIGLIFAGPTERRRGHGCSLARIAAVALLALLVSGPATAREQKQKEPPGLLTIIRNLFTLSAKTSPKAAPKTARPASPQATAQPRAKPVENPTRKSATAQPWAKPVENPARRPTVAQAGCSGTLVKSAYYFSGRRTASGETFDPHGLTAAHRTLPFGTRLRVTNPRTGQSTTVRINDRGPFVRGVSLDLSLGAAKAIGMRGTEHVCIS